MANEKRLIDANALMEEHCNSCKADIRESCKTDPICGSMMWIVDAPTVDAVEMPKGKPGDYLEWDNGTGFRQTYCIASVMICEDCVRYELANFTPVVNHPNIVRIMSREEAEKEWHERCARERAEEEPTLTACRTKMDGDGNA